MLKAFTILVNFDKRERYDQLLIKRSIDTARKRNKNNENSNHNNNSYVVLPEQQNNFEIKFKGLLLIVAFIVLVLDIVSLNTAIVLCICLYTLLILQ